MLPSLVEKDIEEGIRTFIEREFPVATPGFRSGTDKDRSIVDDFLATRENFIKGPWLEIKRPFRKTDEDMTEVLPYLSGRCGIGTEFKPYQHQLVSFKRLHMPGGQSTIVATGTGSGKTECFLYPVLDYVIRARKEGVQGIKAIIIYPMNALATDQARRLNSLCFKIQKKIDLLPSVGLFTGAPGEHSSVMDSDRGLCITDHKTLRNNPPDILLTNYKMLDYLLLREEDQSLWKDTTKESLRYLIVDELHTFDGAQGTDLACLIRRLRDRLGLDESLTCVGTSATLGGGSGMADLQDYASQVFGADFSEDAAIVKEDRLSPSEYFASFGEAQSLGTWPTKQAIQSIVALPQDVSHYRYISTALRAWFPRELLMLQEGNEGSWKRIACQLSGLLPHLDAFKRILSADESIFNVSELADDWKARIGALKGLTHDEVVLVIRSLAALISMAREPLPTDPSKTIPFLNVRVQMWMRELTNMVATVDRHPRLMPAANYDPKDGMALPVVTCRHCNATAWGAVIEQNKVKGNLQAFYKGWFSQKSTTKLIYPVSEFDYAETVKNYPREMYVLCQRQKTVHWIDGQKPAHELYHGPCPICGRTHDFLVVRIPDTVRKQSTNDGVSVKMVQTCPYCEVSQALRVVGARSATLSAAVLGHLRSSTANDDPKLIAFSDSVQDAALRSGFLQARSYLFAVRQAMAGYLRAFYDPNQDFADLLLRVPAFWKERLGGLDQIESLGDPTTSKNASLIAQARFVSTFVPTDMMWRQAWINFSKWATGEFRPEEGEGHVSKQNEKIDHLAFFSHLFSKGDSARQAKMWESFCTNIEGRLRWEIFIEMTTRAHSGRTIEHAFIGTLAPMQGRVAKAIELFKAKVENRIGGFKTVSDSQLACFIEGFLNHQKSTGAFDLSMVPGLGDFMQFVKTGNTFQYFQRSRTLPGYGLGYAPPLPLVMRRFSNKGRRDINSMYDAVLPSGKGENWYSLWLSSCFANAQLEILPAMEEVYQHLFDALIEANLMKVVYMTTQEQTPVYLLNPAAWTICNDLKRVVCPRCGRWHIVPAEKQMLWATMPCLSKGCPSIGHKICNAEEAKGLFLGDPSRTVSREHTGNVESEERGRIESSFSKGREPWDINLLSATPTLEMGIDIGDLSSVMLASMPPKQANYIQRIGRAGRRDGNALAMTICGNNAHAQYFWSDPDKMLSGAVEAPGVFLHAMAVIERQLMAFAITRWMQATEGAALPKKIGPLLKTFAKTTYKPESFPQGFLDFVENRADHLLLDFVHVFNNPKTSTSLFTPEERARLKAFLLGDPTQAVTSLKDRLIDKLRSLTDEKLTAELKVRDLGKALNQRRKDAEDEARDADIAEITSTIESLNALIAKEYVDKDTLQILTDEGLLPNYAFPEEGIKVEGMVLKLRDRSRENKDDDTSNNAGKDKKGSYKRFQFQRAASSGLLEVAPNSTFYVNDFALHIDQVELGDGKVERWHFCPRCQYSERDLLNNSACCPRCGDPRWAAGEQLRTVLKMKTVYAWADIKNDRISDDREERPQLFQNRRMLIDIPASAIRNSFVTTQGGEGFGFEYLSSVTIRDFNFGTGQNDAQMKELSIGSEKVEAPGFTVCDCCGRLRPDMRKHSSSSREDHDFTCKYWRHPEKAQWIDGLVLYREFTSEALRIRVPGGMLAKSNSPEMITTSLSAALRLGLRKYFRGSVDHLRIVDISLPREGKPPQRYIIVHDTVPGGTGYLKELMTDPNNLMHVFELSLDAMANCACSIDPDADGCYQCLYQLSNASRRTFISKQCATDVVSFILNQRQNMASGQLDEDDPTLGDSELEAAFIRALRNDTSVITECKECHSGGNRVYFLIKTRSGRLWHMDLQVDFTGTRPSRPDFVFRPAHEKDVTNALTMAVFTDGWQFHAPIVADDIAKRQSLLNQGIHVWTLGWNDIPKEFEEAHESPVLPYGLTRQSFLVQGYDQQLKPHFEKRDGCAYPTGAQVLEQWVNDQNNFSRLLAWLDNPEEATKACHVLSAFIAMEGVFDESGRRQMPVQACPDIDEALHGSRPQKGLMVNTSKTGCWQVLSTVTPPYRQALFADADLCKTQVDEAASSPVAQDLLQYWSMANVLQFAALPLLLPYVPYGVDEPILGQNPWYDAIEQLKMTELNASPVLEVDEKQAVAPVSTPDADWDDLMEFLPEEMNPIVDALSQQGVPKPEAGVDWINPATGEIEETFDLYWSSQQLAVVYGEPAIRTNGGITIYPETTDVAVLVEALKAACNE